MAFTTLLLALLSAEAVSQPCVVLLHGLARTEKSMRKLEKALLKEDYTVINQGYVSRKQSIEQLADTVFPRVLSSCPKNETVHFVTHSMGGILVRYYLSQQTLAHLGRVVMLGPPNQGSEIVDRLKGVPGFKAINGPAGLQLGTQDNDLPRQLGAVDFDLGIIAGTRKIDPLLSLFLPGKDDGKVSVENTKVKGMNDHLVLPVTHTFMMKNKKVIQQVMHYLKNGHFKRE